MPISADQFMCFHPIVIILLSVTAICICYYTFGQESRKYGTYHVLKKDCLSLFTFDGVDIQLLPFLVKLALAWLSRTWQASMDHEFRNDLFFFEVAFDRLDLT